MLGQIERKIKHTQMNIYLITFYVPDIIIYTKGKETQMPHSSWPFIKEGLLSPRM